MHSNSRVVLFVTSLCVICALILSLLNSMLKGPQERAQELYQSKQLLVAAGIITSDTHLSDDEILNIYHTRVHPMLTDAEGNSTTFKEAGIDEATYIRENKDTGYSHLKEKLIYVISDEKGGTYGYVIPINGFGLWDAIYGYIGLEANGNTVVGTTWYDQKETPGLGAEISTVEWQSQFKGKEIFRETQSGALNRQTAQMGIQVLKMGVEDELGNSPEAKNAVDGISGATLTSNGVAAAYHDSLTPYREFLIKHAKGGS